MATHTKRCFGNFDCFICCLLKPHGLSSPSYIRVSLVPLDVDEFVDRQEQEAAERVEATEMLTRRREREERTRQREEAVDSVLQRLAERLGKRRDAGLRAEEAREEVRRQGKGETHALVGGGNTNGDDDADSTEIQRCAEIQ